MKLVRRTDARIYNGYLTLLLSRIQYCNMVSAVHEKMPRMQGSSIQCCMCLTGVFMFLGGVIMLSTGICLILNYGLFDNTLLPPDMQTEDGKKTVGIILSTFGFLCMVISVLVSTLYLCNKNKPSTINPHDISRVHSRNRSSGGSTPDKRSGFRPRVSSGASTSNSNRLYPLTNGTSVASNAKTAKPKKHHKASTPGSTEVKLPRQAYTKSRHRHKRKFHTKGRLEEIKEADAISRKTIDGALPVGRELNDTPVSNDTPRSGSITSEQTVDEFNNKNIPTLVFGLYDETMANEPSSSVDDSCSTSLTSDISNYRILDNDKSRRDLQFMSAARIKDFQNASETMSKDSVSIDRDDLSYTTVSYSNRLADNQSFTSDTSKFPPSQQSASTISRDVDDKSSAGGNSQGSQQAQRSLPESDDSVISYRATIVTNPSGVHTAGRVSPQIGELESLTQLEIEHDHNANNSLPADSRKASQIESPVRYHSNSEEVEISHNLEMQLKKYSSEDKDTWS